MHKQIQTAKNFDREVDSLVQFIRSDEEVVYVDQPRKRFRVQDGGKQVTIKTVVRHRAEKRYRRKAKRQTELAAQGVDIVVENIAYCQSYDWRF